MYADKKAGYFWSHGSHTGSPLGLYIKGAVATEFNIVTDNSLIVPTIRKVAKF
jgi:alkaline phosphatase